MRGTPRCRAAHRINNRFIPAHAGNTTATELLAWRYPVHPRACGEHSGRLPVIARRVGSSPRMRGTLRPPMPEKAAGRFIPAHAGNTSATTARRIWSAVHPRACGEHLRAAIRAGITSGSSPRMRGTRHGESVQWTPQRFIPAHAGNTGSAIRARSRVAVHPRACGEHTWPQRAHETMDGSSPRMRGTRPSKRGGLPRERFIPAHAGNTPGPPTCGGTGTVHPRACGEHHILTGRAIGWIGSSPRMRGTQHLVI